MINFKNYKWILVPAILLLVFASIGFVVSTFYDLEAAEWLGKGMRYQTIKFVVVFYSYIGMTIWSIPLCIAAFIWLETFYSFKKTKKDSWFKANSKSIWYVYLLWFVLWAVANIHLLYKARFIDQGWGIGINVDYVTTWVYGFISRVIAFISEATIYMGVIYLLRFKLAKSNFLYNRGYWIDGVKVVSFIVISYIILLFIKHSFGRPYYMNLKSVYETTILQEAINEGIIDLNSPESLAKFYESQSKNLWGNAEVYLPWYEINGNWFYNLKFWIPGLANIADAPGGWRDIDFPSGHTLAMFCFLSNIFYFVGRNKPKVSKLTKTATYLWIPHLLIMMTTLCVARSHWLTDVFFSCMVSIPGMYLIAFKAEKVCLKINLRWANKCKESVGDANLVFNNKRAFLGIEKYGTIWNLKSFKYSANFDNKVDKHIKKIKVQKSQLTISLNTDNDFAKKQIKSLRKE
ncbi:phosphatase PAP2 family protein [Mesoplasma syrphidae]|uniref:Phosphatase PAP2 family protein n=1 Tax=Mesoplasma syrphidae TaxID=225999 RepID=A0A2K9BYB4_9MOLU|nr:phosphatase PAP2 family protein [Mesoplasma syrphidae]AUF83358.1 phosphatase PAP2 family protein [Mesoplasma syrphidae]